jgi:hypothetical protein
MHDDSTRAMQICRRMGAIRAALLAAVLFQGASFAASPKIDETTTIQVKPARTTSFAHDVAITQVANGEERLEFSARLSENGGAITRGIAWLLRDSSGAVIFNETTPVAGLAAPPGDYTIEATYGAAHLSQPLTLLQGNRLQVSFVLNLGGIRILPRLKGLGALPPASQTYVYANSGPDKGKLMAVSELPGEVFRVIAGDYRVESRFIAGNARAVADVTVKPGIMSAVEIDHVAGIARLSYTSAADAEVFWQVFDSKGEAFTEIEGAVASIVLKPGSYTAKARVGSDVVTASFDIAEGQEREITLGK